SRAVVGGTHRSHLGTTNRGAVAILAACGGEDVQEFLFILACAANEDIPAWPRIPVCSKAAPWGRYGGRRAVRYAVKLARGANSPWEAAPCFGRASYLSFSPKVKAQAEAVKPGRTGSAGVTSLWGAEVLQTANG